MFLTNDNHIKWKRLALATVVCAVLVTLGIAWFDKPLLMFFRAMDGMFWRALGWVFDDKIWFAVFALTVAIIFIKKRLKTSVNYKNVKNRFSLVAVFRDFWQKTKGSNVFLIFCSIVSAGVLTLVLKTLVGRARPILYEMMGLTGFYPPSIDWAFNSMPSGHAAVSFAALVMIGMLSPRFKPLTWTVAVLIAVSRVCVGAHWPTDVLLGAFIGMVMADFVKYALKKA